MDKLGSCSEDAAHLALQIVDHSRDVGPPDLDSRDYRRVIDMWNAGKSYLKAKADFHVLLSGEPGKYHLVFRRIPLPFKREVDRPINADNLAINEVDARANGEAVLVRPGYAPQSPKEIVAAGVSVASRVWLEAPEDWIKLRRDILALRRFPQGQGIFEIVGGFSERKMGSPRVAAADLNGSLEHGLVQGVAEVLENVVDATSDANGKGLCEAHFNDVVSGLRVMIGDYSQIVTFGDDAINHGLKVQDFFVYPVE